MKNNGVISRPLIDLLEDGFHWNPKVEEAFVLLKEAMREVPKLALLDFKKPFILETDVSDKGIGVVLIQEDRP